MQPLWTWRWWLRPPWPHRHGLQASSGAFVGYAAGVAWAVRFGPFVLTRFAGCSCRRSFAYRLIDAGQRLRSHSQKEG
jgi:hypothetical protein